MKVLGTYLLGKRKESWDPIAKGGWLSHDPYTNSHDSPTPCWPMECGHRFVHLCTCSTMFVCPPLSFSTWGFVQIEKSLPWSPSHWSSQHLPLICKTPVKPKVYLILMGFSGAFIVDLLGYFGAGNQSVVIVKMWQIATLGFRVNGRKQTPGGWFTLFLSKDNKNEILGWPCPHCKCIPGISTDSQRAPAITQKKRWYLR